jgi:hypothetical protein
VPAKFSRGSRGTPGKLLLATACRNRQPATAANVLEAVVATTAESPAVLLELGAPTRPPGCPEALAVIKGRSQPTHSS